MIGGDGNTTRSTWPTRRGGAAGPAGASRVCQILLNLLSNAVKFTERGEVVVTVGGEMARWQAGYPTPVAHFASPALLRRDTGIGIPADRMNRLFQSFSQVDARPARMAAYLGPAIPKRLVGDGRHHGPTVGWRRNNLLTISALATAPLRARPRPDHGAPALAACAGGG